jgi:hypothetical protein
MAEIAYESKEAVPEAFRDVAVEKDNKFVIDVVNKTDLAQFRENNIKLSQERDGIQSQLASLYTQLGMDPEKADEWIDSYKGLKKIKQQVDDGKLVADTTLDEAIATRTTEMQRQHTQQVEAQRRAISEREAEISTLKQQLNKAAIDREVITAINNEKSGALPSATTHILREAYDVFRPMDGGRLVPFDAEGKIMYGADGSTPMTPLEWLAKLREQSPFFFKGSVGGGANGSQEKSNRLTPAEFAAMSPQEKMNRARAGV